ncbi:MAG: BNR-4 repeat-containing protein [Sedimentisphaerales bacterium]|nr:BNR-4 repeat-containing protein [Sedimentisphaerales bacterium]
MKRRNLQIIFLSYILIIITDFMITATAAGDVTLNQKDTGYRGLWYYNEVLNNEYVYKYSGGLGTFCAKHRSFCIYRPEVNKTFFCYGGTTESSVTHLLHMVSYYDHTTGMAPRPTIVLDKQTDDGHDNPVMTMDSAGYIWLFSTSHGTNRPSYIHRSNLPYDIETFVQIAPTRLNGATPVAMDNFSYMQPWYIPSQGFFAFFTRYNYPVNRTICYMTSTNGINWSEWKRIATIESGSYQTGLSQAGKAATAFNIHPNGLGVNYRTNLYYVESTNNGGSWKTASGATLSLPLTTVSNAALVHDYQAEGLLVYLKDIRFDAELNPIILYLTAPGYESGPENDPRIWRTARWTGSAWDIRNVTTSDNNYDMGSLYIEADGTWRIIAPTETGPQPYNTGGEIAVWVSSDLGVNWTRQATLTQNSMFNHTYVRRAPAPHPDFYGYWADGHGRQPSISRLYFCNQQGGVFQLPFEMVGLEEFPVQINGPWECLQRPSTDLNNDCKVDMADLAMFINEWLTSGRNP